MEIVLYSPDIAENVGNIARTCAATKTQLTIVRPFNFNLNSKKLKRAGMDYWDHVEWQIIDSLEELLEKTSKKFFFLSTHGKKIYTEIPFDKENLLIFGSETSGLPQYFHEKYPELFYTIPMQANCRSLNLANSVAIVLYEALRQQNFKELL